MNMLLWGKLGWNCYLCGSFGERDGTFPVLALAVQFVHMTSSCLYMASQNAHRLISCALHAPPQLSPLSIP